MRRWLSVSGRVLGMVSALSLLALTTGCDDASPSDPSIVDATSDTKMVNDVQSDVPVDTTAPGDADAISDGATDTGTDALPSDLTDTQDVSDITPDTSDPDVAPDVAPDVTPDVGPDVVVDPCEGVSCTDTQHCEGGVCVDNSCDTLECLASERCEAAATGGARCVDNTCVDDLNCPSDQYCNFAQLCAPQVCVPDERRCDAGETLIACQSNGGGEEVIAVCGGAGTFMSECVPLPSGSVGCTCRDDWDCPTNMICEVGVCEGTGQAPTCSLPPLPFATTPPDREIAWGGLSMGNRVATGSPYSDNAQVLDTPVVMNLDDDNGDGLINELDFPEIIFMTYDNDNLGSTNGVVRAIHGGPPSKRGQDFFAACGDTVWQEGASLNGVPSKCVSEIHGFGSLAAGDLDGDGIPEIVAPGSTSTVVRVPFIFSNTGVLLGRAPNTMQWGALGSNPAISIADMNADGVAEIIVGDKVYTVQKEADGTFTFLDLFSAPGNTGRTGNNAYGPISCLADINGDNRLDLVAGTLLLTFPQGPPGVARPGDCVGTPANAEETAFCASELLVVWDAVNVNSAMPRPGIGAIPAAQNDGFCGVADVLGADPTTAPGPQNPLDGTPEVVLIADGWLVVLDRDGVLRRLTNLTGGNLGGAPTVDDFDGDGFPEIATALADFYTVIDLQDAEPTYCPVWTTQIPDEGNNPNPARNPGGTCSTDSDCNTGAICRPNTLTNQNQCVCLHNSWRQDTEDDSSRSTGSSVFDFNGDGLAEVAYNDECYFRVYDGLSGEVLFKTVSLSRTGTENVVVADTDNDGNAEIVVPTNNQFRQCSLSIDGPNGLQVYGDPSDTWVSARRVWNQHGYHVTNVHEDGSIPTDEVASWGVLNTYRSQPRGVGVAPDLVVDAIQVVNPDAACGVLGDNVTISARITNRGDLRVGPGVVVRFFGTWAGAKEELLVGTAPGTPLEVVLATSLEPGRSVTIRTNWDVNSAGTNPASLPDEVELVVDPDLGMSGFGAERECIENNNSASIGVVGNEQGVDLLVAVTSATVSVCPNGSVDIAVTNSGNGDATNVEVALYAGDPEQGGTLLHTELVGTVTAGSTVTSTIALTNFPENPAFIFAVVDPAGSISECDEGNNQDQSEDRVACEFN